MSTLNPISKKSHLEYIPMNADYTKPLHLPSLDGILLTNALHYHKNKLSVLNSTLNYLIPGGRFILVEYNTDRGNPWAPYPLASSTWERLAGKSGFMGTHLIGRVSSSFLGEFYSALSFKPELAGSKKGSRMIKSKLPGKN